MPADNGDDDGDGVPNTLDKCPDTTKGTNVSSNGCRIIQLGAINNATLLALVLLGLMSIGWRKLRQNARGIQQ